jgi:hypothetical protein
VEAMQVTFSLDLLMFRAAGSVTGTLSES